MRLATEQGLTNQPYPGIQVRVFGPDSAPMSQADTRRLFRGHRMTAARRDRVSRSGRVVAACGTRVVGVAAFERTDSELRVHEVGIDSGGLCLDEQVINSLLDALEMACLAGGGRRLVLLPRAAVSTITLQRRGFVTIAEGCAGSWFEKTFAS